MTDRPEPTDRPAIPEHVQRQVRQECHFGCVICGMPLFQYDHIVDFAESQAHDASNLALLCPNHHADKTAKRLSRERVMEARQRPFNANRRQTTGYQVTPCHSVRVRIGSNQASSDGSAVDYRVLWINGAPFLTIHRDEDRYTYSANVTDALGHSLLVVDHGELRVATSVWDYRYEGTTVSVRAGKGEILFRAQVADDVFHVERGTFVDECETGILVKPNGAAVFTMSGLHVGEIRESRFQVSANGGIAVVRRSCCEALPDGFGFVRDWPAEYETMAAALQQEMESGAAGRYPKGLATFVPFPRK